jgi:hypothetical protein
VYQYYYRRMKRAFYISVCMEYYCNGLSYGKGGKGGVARENHIYTGASRTKEAGDQLVNVKQRWRLMPYRCRVQGVTSGASSNMRFL